MPDDSDVSGGAGAPRGRDFWDKAQAIAGLATAVLVALIGGLFTYVYNQWQLSAQQPWQPASPTTGQTVHFDGTSSSCSSGPCTYTWQGDGPDGPGGTNYPLGTGVTLDRTFQSAGTKYVRLTVRDHSNRTATVEHDVTVTAQPPPAGNCATVGLWCGDFETGDFSQYQNLEWSINNPRWAYADAHPFVGDSESTIITSPVAQGTYAAKCVVYPSDGVSAADRCENNTTDADLTGDTSQPQFYGWWTRFPGPSQDWWPTYSDFNDITQFGEYPNGLDGANWLYFGIDATHPVPRMYVIFNGSTWLPNTPISDPLLYDHWYHFIVEARWSSDPAFGYVSVWLDGVNVVPRRYGQTLTGTATGVHVNQGIYRAAYSSTNTVIHDGLCRAATFTDAAAC
jgi:hypothetical protein